MSEPKWTPGDWYASKMSVSDDVWESLKPTKAPIAVVLRGGDVIAAVWCGDDNDGEEKANADIMAAAPGLYGALKFVMERVVNEAWPTEATITFAVAQAETALARARGEEEER